VARCTKAARAEGLATHLSRNGGDMFGPVGRAGSETERQAGQLAGDSPSWVASCASAQPCWACARASSQAMNCGRALARWAARSSNPVAFGSVRDVFSSRKGFPAGGGSSTRPGRKARSRWGPGKRGSAPFPRLRAGLKPRIPWKRVPLSVEDWPKQR
jgi:hypothetical protein